MSLNLSPVNLYPKREHYWSYDAKNKQEQQWRTSAWMLLWTRKQQQHIIRNIIFQTCIWQIETCEQDTLAWAQFCCSWQNHFQCHQQFKPNGRHWHANVSGHLQLFDRKLQSWEWVLCKKHVQLRLVSNIVITEIYLEKGHLCYLKRPK